MADPIRDLLISLSSHMAYMQGQLEARGRLGETEDYYWYRESVLLRQKVMDALADEPAVPEGREPATWTEGVCGDGAALLKDGVMVPIEAVVRELNEGARARAALADEPAAGEPASVTGQFMPTDAELLCIAAEEIDGYGNGINPGDYEPSTEMAVEAYGSELCAYARAVLARWGNPAPQPVPVSERLPGPKDCDDQKRCWWLVHQSWPCLYLMKADSGLAAAVATHWLPAHALPIPHQQENAND